jgi:predicted LPLAT superfamily acyltransferase
MGRIVESLRVDGASWRRLAAAGSVHAPEWFKRSAPPLVAAILFALVGDRRRAAIANLERVLRAGRWTARWAALRMFSEFAYCTSEAMEHYAPHPVPLRVDRGEPDRVQLALREGRGVVVVTGHLGSWDIGAKALLELGSVVNVVMARETNPTAQDFVRSAREQAGVRIVFSDESVFSSLGLVAALRRNEVVAIQLDRVAGAGGLRMLPFLGAPAPFPSGPFVLARLARSPIVPVFFPRVGRRHYEIRFGERIDVPRDARDPAVLDRVMSGAVRQLEDAVRRDPTQWFQFAPFWVDGAASRRERAVVGDTTLDEPAKAREDHPPGASRARSRPMTSAR